MKRILLIIPLLAVFSCQKAAEEMVKETETPVQESVREEGGYKLGRMIVRFTPQMTADLEANTREDGRVDVSSVQSMGTLSKEIGIVSMERLFPYAGKFEERTRREGLHRWYQISFDPDASLTKAHAGFGHLEGAEVVEYDPVIEIVGNPVVLERVSSPQASQTSDNAPFNDPFLSRQWHYYNDGTASSALSGCDINVYPVWTSYTTGRSDVIVSVVDGGVDWSHEDLSANMWHNPEQHGNGQYGYNFCRNNYSVTADDHGTHVAGTIAAVNNNGVGLCGIAGGNAETGAEGIRIMSCQIFEGEDGSGSGASAIKWGADHGAVISQNSWGYKTLETTPQSVISAVDYFTKYAGFDENGQQVGPMAGGLVIFAAGNENRATSSSDYSKILCVTSVGADYRRAYYSNWGDYADIAAPGGDAQKGNQIWSTLPGNKYGRMQGTSMACPHVSGVAALIVSRYGGQGFTNQALRDRLENNTTDISAYNRSTYMGKGLVNAYKAIAGSGGIAPDAPTALSGTAQSNNIDFSVVVPQDRDDGKPTSIIVYYDTKPISSLSGLMFSSFYVKDANEGDTIEGRISGLEFETKYYLVAVASDLAGNHSGKSNSAAVTTGSNNAPVITALSPLNLTFKPHESGSIKFNFEDPDGHFTTIVMENETEAETLDTLDMKKPGVNIIAVNAPTGTYHSKIVVTDLYGLKAEMSYSFTVLENHLPVAIGTMPDQIFSKRGVTVSVDEADYFRDDDGEQLAYTIVNTDENVANVNYSAGKFYITSLNLGIAEVSITAKDIRGATASQSFRILVRSSSDPVDIYPNPVKDFLYVRTSADASAHLSLIGPLGSTVYNETLNITPFSPAKIDVSAFPAGVYKAVVVTGDTTVEKTVVKI